MTKYYYDCPIQALYMKMNFDVQFESLDADKEHLYVDKHLFNDFSNMVCDIQDMLQGIKKIYVAKQSEDIFEPREGDIGQVQNDNIIFQFEKWTEEYYKKRDLCKIIIRNNKQFFMPKQEENE